MKVTEQQDLYLKQNNNINVRTANKRLIKK